MVTAHSHPHLSCFYTLICYLWIGVGVTLALGVLPLMINQYFANIPPVNFHAVVIEKKWITVWKPRHGSSKHPYLKVRTDNRQEMNLSFLHQKLNLQDHVNIQVRRGWLGVRFYSTVYKEVKINRFLFIDSLNDSILANSSRTS